jgi:hypothetical protein
VRAIVGTTSSQSRNVARELQRETRLAGSTRPDQRQQPNVLSYEKVASFSELPRATDKDVRLRGQSRRPAGFRVERREVGRKTLDLELVEAPAAGQVPEYVLTQITERDTVAEQRTRRLREQHLTAVSRRHHACSLMDIEPDIVSVDEPRRTRMQADAYADRIFLGPLMFGERTLRLRSSRYRLGRRLEGNEEGIAFGLPHVASVALESPAEDHTMSRKLRRIPVPQPPKQTRRALDVAEQERDRAARRPIHRPSITPGRRAGCSAVQTFGLVRRDGVRRIPEDGFASLLPSALSG